MAGTTFLHGVEVIEVDDGTRPIQTVRSAVIGLVATAPSAAPAVAATLTHGSAALGDGIMFTAASAGTQGNALSVEIIDPGTANEKMYVSLFDNKVIIWLATDASKGLKTTASEIERWFERNSYVTAKAVGNPKSTEPIKPMARAYLSGGRNEPFPLNKPVAVVAGKAAIDNAGSKGTLAKALDDIKDQAGALVVVVRVEETKDDAGTQANVIKGMDKWLSAKTDTGYQPRILVAPEFSQYDGVAAELNAKAKRLRAMAYLDCDKDASYTDAMKLARNYGERVEISWPWINVFDTDLQKDVARPSSARAAGLRVRIDGEKGFWWSKSNQELYGVVGTYQAVDWALDDTESTANMLNENKVSTIINEGGYRWWGNRTCSVDPKWTFEQTRRTADIINDSILRAHLWAVDRNITKTYVDDVVASVNAYLRELKELGAIIGGECWASPGLNTPESIAKGVVYFDFEFVSPYPAEHIIFRSRINKDYLEEVFN